MVSVVSINIVICTTCLALQRPEVRFDQLNRFLLSVLVLLYLLHAQALLCLLSHPSNVFK